MKPLMFAHFINEMEKEHGVKFEMIGEGNHRTMRLDSQKPHNPHEKIMEVANSIISPQVIKDIFDGQKLEFEIRKFPVLPINGKNYPPKGKQYFQLDIMPPHKDFFDLTEKYLAKLRRK
ncbi:hypothetical protein HY989_06870 [Candidatus Micrarchaeota archaeon]|nr:hypothetical protein [Candidatus Micrarchaeota archaeon]